MAAHPKDEPGAAPMLRRFTDLRGYTIGATDGDIGAVDDLYFDDLTWTARYLVVNTGTWLSGRKVLLSPAVVRGLAPAGRRVETPLTRRQVQESPSIDTDKPVSRQHEIDLSSYYGYPSFWAGPLRWGPYAYPYPMPEAGALSATADQPSADRIAEEEVAAREEQSRDPHLRSARAVTGYGIRATDGDLGHVDDFLIGEDDWAIRYLVVDPRSWWPGAHVLVAADWIRRVSWTESVVEVDVTREAIRNAPRLDTSGTFGRDDEVRLYAHHRRPGYWERGSDVGTQYPPAA